MRGLSLIEVLVSLVIGLIVVGAVLVSYLGSGKTSKVQAAYAEMNENAQIAMTIMNRDLLLAGYAQPTGVSGGSTFTRSYSDRPIFGCDKGLDNVSRRNQTAPWNSSACALTGAADHVIEVVYEADLTNTVPTSANIPSDCIGNALPTTGAGTATFYIAHNRFYLSSATAGKSELYCASQAGGTGQPLVDNVEAMRIWYGEANAANPRQIVKYVSASSVVDWGRVLSVRVCLQMKSSDAVLNSEDTLTYLDCDGVERSSADSFARRAYFTTTTLRNKMAF
jgi:type IV pilus assembly protein PilW